ncbi:MAG: hypothetical protein U0796_15065 [Gemmatales bacterium]
MHKFTAYLQAALLVSRTLIKECRVAPRDHFQREASNALRCMQSRLDRIHDITPSQELLDDLDCIITLTEQFNEIAACPNAMAINVTMNAAYERLHRILNRHQRKTKVAKLQAA